MISLFTTWQKINFNFSKIYSSSLKGNNLFVQSKFTLSWHPPIIPIKGSVSVKMIESVSQNTAYTQYAWLQCWPQRCRGMPNLRVPQLREQILNPWSEPKKHCIHYIVTSWLEQLMAFFNRQVSWEVMLKLMCCVSLAGKLICPFMLEMNYNLIDSVWM